MTIGTPAPPFELRDQNKELVSLESFRGSKTLIVFMPFPFTGICDDETCAIRDHLAQLNDLEANVLIITVHAVPVVKKWSDENGFTFPVLSDYWPHGEVSKSYGAFNETLGAANRFTFVLDSDGIVRDVINSEALGVARELDAYFEAIAKL